MIDAGIVGGGGYTAGELIRLLLHHPEINLDFVYSRSQGGKPVSSIHQDLVGEADFAFADAVNTDVDVIFLCMGHGNSRPFLEENPLPEEVKIVDLSRDFRLKEDDTHGNNRQFIYGLPELNYDSISKTDQVANPGCFATGIQLALLPMADNKKLLEDVNIHAITGSTGAGQKPRSTTHFSWREGNVSIYKAFTHQHLDEIKQSVGQLQGVYNQDINFIPMRGNFTRGIFVSAYTKTDLTEHEAVELYKEYYSDAQFTHVSPEPLHLKQVVNTNKCILHVEKHGDNLLVTSIIDNLLKGASGQAVHNMNLMLGLPEDTGLQLKSSYF
ncbi:N-acetyl-gamma-glutamyl-phosphate reductase [Aliifodinibius sp. S!AR15-10]|uniref:N-acetyl-gamma-glutamyl-phosphate reductase n=1 Tax=Aliifodinibius sp. S!AR15-10 TaxID=2950437 RepID=UPI00285AC635|nr:N-acetyl-gamma-glutamyl-phosphate reductase [Aliifodinibius sp. S!AR15-10]MDR8392183.1 N-acetyl-gamma-glutamyl-phosphate reductase [Aliifodinibius sp. S!AR15-10]